MRRAFATGKRTEQLKIRKNGKSWKNFKRGPQRGQRCWPRCWPCSSWMGHVRQLSAATFLATFVAVWSCSGHVCSYVSVMFNVAGTWPNMAEHAGHVTTWPMSHFVGHVSATFVATFRPRSWPRSGHVRGHVQTWFLKFFRVFFKRFFNLVVCDWYMDLGRFKTHRKPVFRNL